MAYKLVVEVTDDTLNPLHRRGMFVKNSKLFLHDYHGKEHIGKIVDITTIE